MIVCNCNRINEHQTRAAIAAGARRWSDVHAYHGCKPCCGKCGPEIRGLMGTLGVGPADGAAGAPAPAVMKAE